MNESLQEFPFAREISPSDSFELSKHNRELVFSIGTLVTNKDEYESMLKTFIEAGFNTDDCEYLYIDNISANNTSAYSGLNLLLNSTRGDYIILCHQDVRLSFDNRSILEQRLSELNVLDKNWGLAGNAGGVELDSLSIRITDRYGENKSVGVFPKRVISLDENFIVVRKRARLGFSNDLSGFHFYGTDICLHADIMGYNAYVINFHLHHLGMGRMGVEFFEAKRAFEEKWNRALRLRLLQTTCAQIIVGFLCQLDGRVILFRLRRAWKQTEKTVKGFLKDLTGRGG